METPLSYVKHLFIRGETPLTFREKMTGFGILWFLNLLTFQAVVHRSLWIWVISRQSSGEYVAESNVMSMFGGFLFPSIPWQFLLFLGCLLLMRRIYSPKLSAPAGLVLGLPLFLFFVSLIILPVSLAGIPQKLFPFLSDETMRHIQLTCIVTGAAGVAGLVLFLRTLSKSGTQEVREERSPGLDREGFTFRFLVFSVFFLLFCVMFIVIVQHFLFSGFTTSRGRWSSIVLSFGLLGLSLYWIGRRLLDMGKSLLFLLLPLFLPVIYAGGILLLYFVKNHLVNLLSTQLSFAGLALSHFFFLCLCVWPSARSENI